MRSTRRSTGGAGALPGFLNCLRHFLTPAVWKQAQSCCPAVGSHHASAHTGHEPKDTRPLNRSQANADF
jgi:hypothetical protein